MKLYNESASTLYPALNELKSKGYPVDVWIESSGHQRISIGWTMVYSSNSPDGINGFLEGYKAGKIVPMYSCKMIRYQGGYKVVRRSEGKILEAACYYTDDKEDAMNTMASMESKQADFTYLPEYVK